MKILKTVFVIALCAMFLFVFAACSNEETSESSDPENLTDTLEETGDGDMVEVIDVETENAETAEETQAPEDDTAVIGKQNAPVTQQYAGIVKEITKEDGLYNYTITVNDGTSETEIVAMQSEDTIIADAAEGTPLSPEDIKEGEVVEVFLSMMTTRSIPPMSPAYCIIANLPADNMGVPTYIEAAKAQVYDDGSLAVLNQNQDLYVTIPSDVKIGVYGDADKTVSASDVEEGTKLLAWFDAVMESYPAQATADKCIVCE